MIPRDARLVIQLLVISALVYLAVFVLGYLTGVFVGVLW